MGNASDPGSWKVQFLLPPPCAANAIPLVRSLRKESHEQIRNKRHKTNYSIYRS